MGFFRPAWESKNPNTRIKGVYKTDNQEILMKLASTDPVLDIRIAAINKIQDERFLAMLANETNHPAITEIVISKLTVSDVLFSLAVQGKFREIVEQAAIKLTLMGDKHVIAYFSEIKNCGLFLARGSGHYNDFMGRLINVSDSVPCEETVLFLENLMKKSASVGYANACQAQMKLRSICKKVQGTPLADYISKIEHYEVADTYF
ncbi:MAG: hypothetical protein FWB80_14070 [Defluviitaleaceae bacterium]|nr:hypothetical protein [Defluviitaleaceae bacterium]